MGLEIGFKRVYMNNKKQINENFSCLFYFQIAMMSAQYLHDDKC